MNRRAAALWSLVLVTTAALTSWGYSRTAHRYYTEWNFFELGARTLVDYHHQPLYGGGALHVYVTNPQLQIGPLALWLIAPFEWLRWSVVATIFVVAMAVMGVGAVAAVLKVGRMVRGPQRSEIRWPVALAAAAVAGIWGYDCATWRHLDDSIALLLTAVATVLIARRRPWWLVGLLLGTAAATKPWAIMAVPVILGLPRRDIARTMLVVIGTAVAWWAPFIIAAPQTSVALGRYIVIAQPGSVLHLIGFSGPVQGWLRPTQFIVGIGVGSFVALRRHWTAAPLAAIAVRVLTDPYSYAYYGLGPLLFAFLYDRTSQRRTDFPIVTAVTVLVEFVLPPLRPGNTAIAVVKLLWGIGMLALVLTRRDPTGQQPDDDLAIAAPAPATAGLVAA